jgi:hypothetical protein
MYKRRILLGPIGAAMFENLAIFTVISAARTFDLVEDKPADLRIENVVALCSPWRGLCQGGSPRARFRRTERYRKKRVPASEAASTVASASSSEISRHMLPSAAVPNPNGPANSASLTLI